MSLLNQALPNAKQLREAKGYGEVIVQYRGRHTGLPLQKRIVPCAFAWGTILVCNNGLIRVQW